MPAFHLPNIPANHLSLGIRYVQPIEQIQTSLKYVLKRGLNEVDRSSFLFVLVCIEARQNRKLQHIELQLPSR